MDYLIIAQSGLQDSDICHAIQCPTQCTH